MSSMNIPVIRTIISNTMLREFRGGSRTQSRKVILLFMFTLLFAGLVAANISGLMGDTFSRTFILAAYSMVLFGNFILMEFPTLITGEDDLEFYASRPVSSREYYIAKMCSFFLYGIYVGSVFLLPSIIFSIIRGDAAVSNILRTVYTVFTGNLFMGLVIMTLYGVMAVYVPKKRLNSISGIMQSLTMVALYGSMAFMGKLVSSRSGQITISPDHWASWLPNGWFTSLFLDRSIPGTQSAMLIRLALGTGVFLLLLLISGRFVSLKYAAAIERQQQDTGTTGALQKTAAESPIAELISSVTSRAPETWAIWKLSFNHIKYDSRFRTSVISIIPVSIIYFLIVTVINEVPIHDPFTQLGRETFPSIIIIYFACVLFPVMLKTAMRYSADADASWIFHASPSAPELFVAGSRNFTFFLFILPYQVLFFIAYTFFTGQIIHSLIHVGILTVIVYCFTTILFLFFPVLPFSEHPQKGRRSAMILFMFVLFTVVPGILALFIYFVYPRPGRLLFALPLLLITGYFLDKLGKSICARRIKLE